MTWMTNDERAAALLQAADAAYARALDKAENLPLAEKIKAISIARQIRAAAYEVAKNYGA